MASSSSSTSASYSIFYIEYSIVTSCNASEVNYSDATMASSSSSTSDQGPSWKDESDREPQVNTCACTLCCCFDENYGGIFLRVENNGRNKWE